MILKLKRTPGIYLVGFMACGKTTIGRLLADRLGWRFADLDEEIETKHATTIAEIFDKLGEAEFRNIESAALRAHVHSIERGRPTVVALGGGTFAQPENVAVLEHHGVTIWLDCPLETVQQRVGQASHRPLARDNHHMEKLFHARRAAYAQADYRIPIESDDPVAAVEAVLELPLFG
jgi:shikimate kinase